MINAQEAMSWLVEHSPRALALHHKAIEGSLDEELRELTAEEAQALALTLNYYNTTWPNLKEKTKAEFARHKVHGPYGLQLSTNRYRHRNAHTRAMRKLIAGVQNGKLTEAKLLEYLDKGQDINVHGLVDHSLLGCAAMRGHVEVVKLLLKHKADVNLQLAYAADYRYGTPLEEALEAKKGGPGLVEACRLLAEHGARLDVYCAYGYPSLYYVLGCVKHPEALVKVLDVITVRDSAYAKFLANLPSGLLPLHNLLRSRNQGQAVADVAAALLRMGAEPLVERFDVNCCTGLRADLHKEARAVLRQSVLEVLLATAIVQSSPSLWGGIMRLVVEMLIDFTEEPAPAIADPVVAAPAIPAPVVAPAVVVPVVVAAPAVVAVPAARRGGRGGKQK